MVVLWTSISADDCPAAKSAFAVKDRLHTRGAGPSELHSQRQRGQSDLHPYQRKFIITALPRSMTAFLRKH